MFIILTNLQLNNSYSYVLLHDMLKICRVKLFKCLSDSDFKIILFCIPPILLQAKDNNSEH